MITITSAPTNAKFGGTHKFTASEPGKFTLKSQIGSTLDADGNYVAG